MFNFTVKFTLVEEKGQFSNEKSTGKRVNYGKRSNSNK